MTLTEKTAYIKGLADGLSIDENTPEAKLIKALIDLCSEMADEIEAIGADVDELSDYVEEIDSDLGDVEEVLFDEYDDEDADDDDECDGDCANCLEDCEYNSDDEDYFEIICPSCGETVCFDESVNAEEIVCPACGSPLGCIVDEDDKK